MSSPTVQIKARPILSDMPFNIKLMIAENTDIRTRYTLRKVSTHFRAAVDNSKYSMGYLHIYTCRSGNVFGNLLGEIIITYDKNGSDGCVVDWDGGQKQIEGENYLQRAVDDFGIIFKSPFVHLENFEFSIHKEEELIAPINRRILEKLDSFHHKLSVGHLEIRHWSDPDEVLLFLRHLNPGILKSLIATEVPGNCSELLDTEHWPLLEEVRLRNPGGMPISKFLHLKRFSTTNITVTKDVVKAVVQSCFQHPDNFEYFDFCTKDIHLLHIWVAAVKEYFSDRNSPHQKIQPIPGTDYKLRIGGVISLDDIKLRFEKIGGAD